MTSAALDTMNAVQGEIPAISPKTAGRRQRRDAQIPDDTALLTACELYRGLRIAALSAGDQADWRAVFKVKNTLYELPAHTPQGVAARDAVLTAPAPDFPLTGNHAVDDLIKAAQAALDVETRLGVAHTFSEMAKGDDPALAEAEKAAEDAFMAARTAADAANQAILEPPVFSLSEARARLHAYMVSFAYSNTHHHQWRPLSLEEASAIVAGDTYSGSIVEAGMTQYVADVERLTSLPPPTPPSDWTAAVEKVEATYKAFDSLFYQHETSGLPRASEQEVEAARAVFIAARDELFQLPSPDAAALAYKIAQHPDAPALTEPSDIQWHLVNGDSEERDWATIVLDARALAARQAVSPALAALSYQFERAWAEEYAVSEAADDNDDELDAAAARTDKIVLQMRKVQPRTVADLRIYARLVAWAMGSVEDLLREPALGQESGWVRITRDLLASLLLPEPPPMGLCAAAALIEPYRAAVAAEDALEASIVQSADSGAIIDHRDNLARLGSGVVASSIQGVLFQLNLANFQLHRAHDFEEGPDQNALFRLGQTALLNAARAISGITGVQLQDAGWETDVLDALRGRGSTDWTKIGNEWLAKRDRAETSPEFDVHNVDWPAIEPTFKALCDERDALEDQIIGATCDGPILAALKLRVALERVRRDDGHSNWTDQGDVLCINSVLSYLTGQPSAVALRPAEVAQ